MKKILFIVNRTKASAMSIAERLVGYAASAGFDCDINAEFPVDDCAFDGKDVCCAIGGDGTILSCVPSLVRRGIAVFGINLGKLGFLASYNEAISREDFICLVSGGGREISRSLLEADFDGKKYVALNDFVMKDSRADGISTFRIDADGEFIAACAGDGVIFSTPTGSTAYNLSAGGPLIHPEMRAFVMTPICPHTLSNRSLIYGEESKVRVHCLGGHSALIADGRKIADLEEGDEMNISVSSRTLKFLRLKGHSHFAILRSKLGWAEDPRRHLK